LNSSPEQNQEKQSHLHPASSDPTESNPNHPGNMWLPLLASELEKPHNPHFPNIA
jgi:hypothetical protein